MKAVHLAALTLVLPSFVSGASSAMAQTPAELMRELQDLKAKVQALEQQLQKAAASSSATPGAGAATPQWGMTADQVREFNRVRIKTEALEDNFADQGYKGLQIKGMLDPTYLWTRSAGGGFAFLNGFSGSGSDLSYPNDGFGYDNSYFGQAMLDLQKETEDGAQWRLTLAPQKNASSGYNLGSIIHQASVSLPLSDNQTRLIAGQFPDWSGYEYAWSHEQPLITHNLLFDFTLPSFYTGAGLDITRGKWWMRAMAANMNASRYDRDNKAPAFVYRVDYSKGEFDGFGFAGVHGKTFGARVNAVEVDAYYIRGDWTLQGQIGAGRLADGAAAGDARWAGLSALAGYQITPRLKAIARADLIRNSRNGGGILGSVPNTACDLPERDNAGALTGNRLATGVCADGRNGFGPAMTLAADSGEWEPDPSGKGLNRHALSLGLNYLYGLNTTFKVEYRIDGASGNAFFYPDGSWRKRNHLIGTSVVVTF